MLRYIEQDALEVRFDRPDISPVRVHKAVCTCDIWVHTTHYMYMFMYMCMYGVASPRVEPNSK